MSAPSEQKPNEAPKVEKEPSTGGAAGDTAGKKKNKNKKKKEAQKTEDGQNAAAPATASTPAAENSQNKTEESGAVIKKIADLKFEQENQLAFTRKDKKMKEAAQAVHQFWDKQPVTKLGDTIPDDANGPIDPVKDPKKDIPQTPLPLQPGFEWVQCNVSDDAQIKEIYELLNQNYVEDDDNMFRFAYSMEFLRWALTPPGYRPEWHIGVRGTQGKKVLFAFITAIPVKVRIQDKEVEMAEVNFLCVHKRLRAYRLAPVLIQEITRRVNVTNMWQAVYTAGKVLPTPFARCRYYHRSLNPKKLIDIGFSHLPPRSTLAMTQRLYKLPDDPVTPGLRPMTAADAGQVQALLATALKKCSVAPVFTEEEIRHWMVPRPEVVDAWVVENPSTKKVTDVFSFYNLPSSILNNEKYKTLKAAYGFYSCATSVPLKQLMNDALIVAKKLNYDVFNCLDIMDNMEFLRELKFGLGDGNLHYYFYNWKCKEFVPGQIGLVLL